MIDFVVILLLLTLSGCTITGNVVSTGVWIPIDDTNFVNGDALFSNIGNSTLSYDFNGTSLSIITQKRDDFGIMNVYIDNELFQHDLYSADIEYEVQLDFTLEEGSHSLVIEVTGEKNNESGGYYVVVDEVIFNQEPLEATTCQSTESLALPESTEESILNQTSLVEPLTESLVISDNTSHLAQIINGKSIQDDYIVNTYLKNYNYFKNVNFVKLTDSTQTLMTIGNQMDNIRGYELNGLNYSIHLVYCEKASNSCIFRINGINTHRLYSSNVLENVPKSFDIDGDYQLKIASMEFDYCGDVIYCNLHYEAFDRVEVNLDKK